MRQLFVIRIFWETCRMTGRFFSRINGTLLLLIVRLSKRGEQGSKEKRNSKGESSAVHRQLGAVAASQPPSKAGVQFPPTVAS